METMTLDDLCEPWPPDVAPWLDQPNAPAAGYLGHWRDHGYAIFPRFMPAHLIDAYCEAWQRANHDRPTGWPHATPYMDCPELADLCTDPILAAILENLIGEPMGLHLNLTGWRSTQRNWHQDGYLNPDHVADWYAAVWIALDDIDPDSGPFQYVPGSHRWPLVRQDRMLAALTEAEAASPQWPRHSERILTPIFEQRLADERIEPAEFVAKRGDVLIWHARLLHRGSTPRNPDLERRACIAHYSGITHRPDMPAPVQHRSGWYFPL